jgi:hypothetical protein
LLLGHSKIESTVRYLGIEVDDAIRHRAASQPVRTPEISLGLASERHEAVRCVSHGRQS